MGKRRGQPVLVLALVLLSYGVSRALIWQSPFPDLAKLAPAGLNEPELVAGNERPQRQSRPDKRTLVSLDSNAIAGGFAPEHLAVLGTLYDAGRVSRVQQDASPVFAPPEALQALVSTDRETRQRPVRESSPDYGGSTPFAASAETVPASRQADRWSFDSWFFVRQGSSAGEVNTVLPASYGASQAGAVLRYRLAPASDHRPTIYARATHSLPISNRTVNEGEAALGFRARPFAGIPVSANAEARLRLSEGRSEVRTAAFIVTEFPPVKLPLRLTAETYAQAGYVSGNFATLFADGQARVTREVTAVNLGSGASGRLRAGAGAWGGAQRGAARVDVGPSASVDFRIDGISVRAQMDYRIQVAGDAAPGDGIAFTLSTGF
ncbi:hypothetical protein N8940_01535 [Sphingomonadaceae bacterium]|nr:hypothetical protein [Sphingomonadaceae bacterium]